MQTAASTSLLQLLMSSAFRLDIAADALGAVILYAVTSWLWPVVHQGLR
jgi:hypothetical protein